MASESDAAGRKVESVVTGRAVDSGVDVTDKERGVASVGAGREELNRGALLWLLVSQGHGPALPARQVNTEEMTKPTQLHCSYNEPDK